jgi:hypothetical protein
MILGCQASITKQDQVDIWRPAMFRSAKLIALLGCVAVVGACEEVPPGGPTVMALPSAGKNLTTLEQEDGQCRAQAATKIGNVSPGQAGAQAAVGSAAVGTVLGAAAGSAIGPAVGNAGAGAAIGGATGLAGGAAIGANNATTSEGDLQMRYDIAYTECMYSHGDTVQRAPPGADGYYANVGYPYYGYPWYGWAGPGFFGGGIFVVRGDHDFHHQFRGFHNGFHRFHDGFHGAFHSGFHGGGGFHR